MARNDEPKLRPVTRKVAEIVGQLAEARVVETLILNVTHSRRIHGNLSDLSQIIYFALLQTDSDRLEHLATTGQMNFYIVRLITNQFFSETSPFYRQFRKFGRKTCEISDQISETYETGKDYTFR